MKAFPRIPPVVRWFVLPSVVFIAIMSLFYVAELVRRKEARELTESARVERGARLIAGDLQAVVADIVILTKHREFDRLGETLSAAAMDQLAHDFTHVLEERQLYDHVRFLDVQGMEIVRVNFNGGNIKAVAADDLQDKSDRYYFEPMIGLSRDDIYFSALDLNVEQGRVETQAGSTIRVGAPVFDEWGAKRGVVIFNYRGDLLVERFTAAMTDIADHAVLLNTRGEMLFQPVGSGKFAAETYQPASLPENSPTAWKRISAAEAGQFYDDNGLFTFATINPATRAWRSGGQADVSGTPRAAASGAKPYFWKLVSHVPWPTLRAQGHKATQDMLLFPMIPGYILLIAICWLIYRSERGQTRAWAALRESESRYARAVAGTNDGLWEWNIQTGEDYFSPRWAEILGYGPDELEPVVETFTDLIHADDKDRVQGKLQAHLRHKAAFDDEFRLRKKSGEYLWVQSRGRAVWNEDGQPVVMAGSITDISERKLAVEKLKDSEARLRLIINSVPVGITYFDRDERYQYASEGYQALMGLRTKDIVGKTVASVIGEESYERAKPSLKRALAGEKVQHENSVFTKDGRHIFVVVDYVPHRQPSGNVAGFFSLVQDITESRDMEAQLRQAQKMEAVGLLTGGVAHDFNNILAIILGNLELLEEKISGKEEYAQFVTTGISAAERGAKLTEQLLTFSRKQILDPRTIDLNELVVELTGLMRRTLGETIHVTTELESGLWPARIDRNQLSSALLNLAINSRDAMATGGDLVIRTAARRLGEEEARLHGNLEPGAYVSVSVSDTGTGMTPDVRAKAFDPFFTTKDFGEGTGLGLSTVYGFVRQSGGDVTLTSKHGVGTTVELLFPVLEDTMTLPREPGASKVGRANIEATILVVEDDEDVRDITVRMLTEMGHKVLDVGDAAAALRLLESEKIDLLFSDIVLANGIDGVTLSKTATSLYPDLRVLLTTGYPANHWGKLGAIEPGVMLINKPYRTTQLAARIEDLLGSRGSLPQQDFVIDKR